LVEGGFVSREALDDGLIGVGS